MTVQSPAPVRRIRLIRREGRWQIHKQVKIASMTLPKSSELPNVSGNRGVTGLWVETVDVQNRTLYRKLLENTAQSVEIPGEADGTFNRIPAGKQEIFLDVLVPDTTNLKDLKLFSNEQASTENQNIIESNAAQAIATFNLQENE